MKLDGVSHREIAEKLQIHDTGRLKIWMRKVQRGHREYYDTNRYVENVKRENKMLKKCLESQEVDTTLT
ncbi:MULTISPECIES: hypothetical protein [Bacillales]|uniref:hypothetical protein n=1 Tax=Bacillales TaxID=1385 RepID=UPI0006878CA3